MKFCTGAASCMTVNECLYDNGKCSQICVDTYESYYCTCREGYELTENIYDCPGKKSQMPYSFLASPMSVISSPARS